MENKGFTNKEMLGRIMDHQDSMETNIHEKLDKLQDKINDTNIQVSKTNSKVKLHTKLIFGTGGVLITVIGWFLSTLIGG